MRCAVRGKAPDWARLACGLALLIAAGCQPGTVGTDKNPQAGSSAGRTAGKPREETWEAYYLQDAKIGYGHTVVRDVDRAGKMLVETESVNHLKLARFGRPVEQQVTLDTLETADGQLLEFRTEVTFGPTPTIFSGHIDGDAMVVETRTQGAHQEVRIPWSPKVRGFHGAERSLADKPLEPAEKRSLEMLVPLVNQVAEVELTAVDYETTRLLNGDAELLRIETTSKLPDGNVMAETLWADKQGTVHKRRIEGINQESYRTTEKIAKSPASGRTAHARHWLQHHGANRSAAGASASSARNSLSRRADRRRSRRSICFWTDADGKSRCRRTWRNSRCAAFVPAQRPRTMLRAAAEPPDAEYLEANSVLQIDDPHIKAMAAEASGNETDPVNVALALERYVHEIMAPSDFTQAFATAAEVAESRSGDCTEHAVLLAALARACGIPSRVAIGLVYVESSASFGYHMWTEVYLNGQWLPLDATLGQGRHRRGALEAGRLEPARSHGV